MNANYVFSATGSSGRFDVKAASAVHADGWHCVECACYYDPAQGLPEQGVPSGTAWADVPESFGCPHCGAHKVDFEPVAGWSGARACGHCAR